MKEFFKRKYQIKTNLELIQIIEKKDSYELEARQAALEILTDRKGSTLEIQETKNLLEKEENRILKNKKSLFGNGDLVELKKDGPNLYSETVVSVLTLFLSPFMGSVLMYINFLELKKQKIANEVLLFGILFLVLSIVLNSFAEEFYLKYALLSNIIGLLILYQHYWKKHIGSNFSYFRKPWLLTVIALISATFLFVFLIGMILVILI